jgi:hypothetical protein
LPRQHKNRISSDRRCEGLRTWCALQGAVFTRLLQPHVRAMHSGEANVAGSVLEYRSASERQYGPAVSGSLLGERPGEGGWTSASWVESSVGQTIQQGEPAKPEDEPSATPARRVLITTCAAYITGINAAPYLRCCIGSSTDSARCPPQHLGMTSPAGTRPSPAVTGQRRPAQNPSAYPGATGDHRSQPGPLTLASVEQSRTWESILGEPSIC